MDFKETVLELKSPVMELQKDRIVSAGMDTHIQFSGGGRGSGQSPEKDFRFQYRNAVLLESGRISHLVTGRNNQ